MRSIHETTFSRNTTESCQFSLVFHYKPSKISSAPQAAPRFSPDYLDRLWRNLDDLAPSVSVAGFNGPTVAQIGYKTTARGIQSDGISIPRGSVIVACRDTKGRIQALANGKTGAFFTQATPHFSNLSRLTWTREVEVYSSVVEADIAALTHNIAAMSLNGCPLDQIPSHLVGANPAIVYPRNSVEVRAA